MPEFTHDDRRMLQETHDAVMCLGPVIDRHDLDISALKVNSTEVGKKLAGYDAASFQGWRLFGMVLAAAAAGAAIVEVIK